MLRLLNRLFNVYTDEWPRVLYLFVTYFIFGVGVVWASNIITASFLTQLGLQFLPLTFIVQAVITMPALAIYSLFVDHVPIFRMLLIILLLSIVAGAAGLVLLITGNQLVGYPLLYLLLTLVLTLFSVQWWNYFDEFYDTLTAKRIVPVVASAFLFSVVIGGFTLRYLNRIFRPDDIAAIWVLTLIIVMVIIGLMPRVFRNEINFNAPRSRAPGSYLGSIRQGVSYITRSPFLSSTATSAFVLVVFMNIIDYQSKEILLANFDTTEGYANFTATLQGTINLVMLPVQLFLFSRIVTRFGVEDTNLVFPSLSLIIAGAMIFSPPLVVIGALGFFDRTGLRENFQGPIDILMFNTVSLRVKGRAGAVIEGLVKPIGTLIGGSLLLFLPAVSPNGIAGLLLLVALTYLLLSLRLRREYPTELIRTLKAEDFSFVLESSKEITVSDPAIMNYLVAKLDTATDPKEILFVAQLICQTGTADNAPALINRADTPDENVRFGLVDLLVATGWRSRPLRQFYHDALSDPVADIRRVALIGLRQNVYNTRRGWFTALALQLLDDDDLAVRSEALLALISLPPDYAEAHIGLATLTGWLDSAADGRRLAALHVMGEDGSHAHIDRILPLLTDPADEVRVAAIHALAQIVRPDLAAAHKHTVLTALLPLSDDPVEAVRSVRVQILGRLATETAYRHVVTALGDESDEVATTAVETLRAGKDAALSLLVPLRHAPDAALRKQVAVVLGRIRPETYRGLIPPYIDENLTAIYDNHLQLAALARFHDRPGMNILMSTLQERNHRLLDEIFYLLAAIHNPETVRIIESSLGSEANRPNAIEALESLTGQRAAQAISYLFIERLASDELSRLNNRGDIPPTAAVVQSIFDKSDNEWLRSIVVHLVSRTPDLLPAADRDRLLATASTDPAPAVRAVARRWQARDGVTDGATDITEEQIMLSKVEKVIFLKQVPLFETLSVQQLQIMAGICEEVIFEKDDVLFEQGTVGDAMYIIVNGQVAVDWRSARGAVTRLATRGVYDSVGEMSLFDAEPRSATLVALKDTLTLRLNGDPLTRLARKYPDIALALVAVLSQRLREASTRIAELDKRSVVANTLLDTISGAGQRDSTGDD